MARNPNPTPVTPLQFAPSDIQPHERARVEQLIAAGKSDKAVDICKDIHRHRRSPQSEALLLDAYHARFQSLLDRKLEVDARNLAVHLERSYPSAGNRVAEWYAILAARQGNLDVALAPLSDPALAPEKQAAIGTVIRRHAVDLHAIAASPALVPEHPLRVAAGALAKAFHAVTSGPVAEEALALHEVSRQSPLAPWKMMIRAIAAYYRRDDVLCEKYLGAVDPDSAAARLSPALRTLVRKSASPSPAVTALVIQTGGNVEKLRANLKTLDQLFDQRKQPRIVQGIRDTLAACRELEPSLLERLKQHISIRGMLAGLTPTVVTSAMQGGSLKNAHFWRLLARGTEELKDNPVTIPVACSHWEEFRRHAIHERWFPPEGPEVAALYLHMADLWHKVSPDSVDHVRSSFTSKYRDHAEYYKGQPPEIRALMTSGRPESYFLWPTQILQRACQADPCTENFQRWLRCALDSSPNSADQVAEQWSAALPKDIPPLLHLMESAEKRNALQKAFKFMERAEQIDGLNAEVRRARLRLLVAMAIRHLKDRKARLAEGELRQLEALPQAQQGDRPAFISALRWASAQLGGPTHGMPESRSEMVRLLGSELAADVVAAGVAERCALDIRAPQVPSKGVQAAGAIGRACALGEDMGLPLEIPDKLFDRLEKELSSADFTAPVPWLIALGETAIRQELLKMAYAIAGAGLAQGIEGQARFLYLRARGMPPWESDRRDSCLAAASELARRQRDNDLLDRIGQLRDEEMDWMDGPPGGRATSLSAEEIAGVVERESKERGYPKSKPPQGFSTGGCQCPSCRAERGDFDMPPELEEMMEQFGPDMVAKALAEIIGMGGPGFPGGKRRRRKPRFFDDLDIPF